MNKPSAVEPRAFSIVEFCQAYRISRASFYNLQKTGNAPAIFNVGRRTLITLDAAKKWESAMTKKSVTTTNSLDAV